MFVFLLENLNRIVSLYFKIQKSVGMIQDKKQLQTKTKKTDYFWFKQQVDLSILIESNVIETRASYMVKEMISLIFEMLDLNYKQILETSFWSKIVLQYTYFFLPQYTYYI